MNYSASVLAPSLATKEPVGQSHFQRYYDARYRLEWGYMHASPRPCFTPQLLNELEDWFTDLSRQHERDVRYVVMASDVPGVFNLGGDLDLFKRLIETGDRDGLYRYAKACVDRVFEKYNGFDRDITHITLVQGDALGGGFECAISSHVLIAERGSRMGMPEVLFNLFPGMGAYSILSRKLDRSRAERMILGGQVYLAEELYEMGIVDVLAEPGQGELAVYDHIRREDKSRNSHLALRKAKGLVDPVTYPELLAITEVWVDAAMHLEARDLRMMERLVMRQGKKVSRVG